MNYQSKYSLTNSDIFEPVHRLKSIKLKWMWNKTYQEIYDTAEALKEKDVSMKFCDEKSPYTWRWMHEELALELVLYR